MSEAAPMRIGELASIFGVNPKTIRYYERIGVMPEPQRTEVGYRIYHAAAKERLGFILKAKSVGLSLGEIREIVALRDSGGSPCRRVMGLVDEKLASLDAQLRNLQELRAQLAGLRRDADTTEGAGDDDAALARPTATRGVRVCRIIEEYVSAG